MERIEGAAVGRCAASPYLRPLTLHYRQNGTQKSWDFMKTHDSVAILMFNSSQQSLVLVKQFRPAVYVGEVERLFPGSLAAVDQDGPRALPVELPGSAGVTYELCAGLVDQPGLSLEDVACAEAWEECGYRLAPSDLRRVATYNMELGGGGAARTSDRDPGRNPGLWGAVLEHAAPPPCGPSSCCRQIPLLPVGLSTGRWGWGSGVGLTGSNQTMFYAEVTDSQRSGPGGGLAEEGELIQVVHLPLDGAQAFADDPDVPKTLGVIFGISWFLSCVAPGLGPR
ncbi:uridine diphosphate glucose pyrophosphatase NUDT14 isoform X1 [Panthera leo]|uniref:uridine diphosphate glucose pyrophosphatase NUDT14 isoform X1 n=1 Tax=Panthera leo TaxID=9689 RepID=UPI001C6A5C09|nr:uridine diphosphate glucose pyrophosphatase NUDT14 isoform X1 [Panthera leo]